jgi:ADP-ribose pyrophosphatase YjhB (NUDIX family)
MILAPRVPESGQWKTQDDPHPQVTTSGFAYDRHGFFPILWRSDKVRSAKNCWSVPSGLHVVGYTFEEQFAVELYEELGLKPLIETADTIGVYENIACVDNWHWCITVLTMQVETLDSLVNKEPDKHSKIERIHVSDLMKDEIVQSMNWAPNLKEAILKYRVKIFESIMNRTALLR